MFSTSFFVCLRFYVLYVPSNLQENGHSSEYTWILSTGWWEGRAPVNPDAVVVVGILCIILIGGFVYINRYLFEALHIHLVPPSLARHRSLTYMLITCFGLQS